MQDTKKPTKQKEKQREEKNKKMRVSDIRVR